MSERTVSITPEQSRLLRAQAQRVDDARAILAALMSMALAGHGIATGRVIRIEDTSIVLDGDTVPSDGPAVSDA
jgi:uncharacterized membrane protein